MPSRARCAAHADASANSLAGCASSRATTCPDRPCPRMESSAAGFTTLSACPARSSDENVSRDFDAPVRNTAERSSPAWVAILSLRAWRAAVSSTVIQRAVARPARSASWSSATRSSSGPVSMRAAWRLEISTPIPFSNATRRSVGACPWACRAGTKRRSSGPNPPTIPAGNSASTVSPAPPTWPLACGTGLRRVGGRNDDACLPERRWLPRPGRDQVASALMVEIC